jgi:hypothetical protein
MFDLVRSVSVNMNRTLIIVCSRNYLIVMATAIFLKFYHSKFKNFVYFFVSKIFQLTHVYDERYK